MKKKEPIFIPFENSLYTNYKGEVFACEMIENGVDKEKIRIFRKGKSQRGVHKEMDKITLEDEENQEVYNIRIYKRDLYDSLPEGIFHKAGSNGKKQQKSDIIKSIEKGRREEEEARFFFKPFEFFLDRLLILGQLFERRIEKPNIQPEFVQLFYFHWNFLKGIPLDKALFLLNFLSQSHQITESKQIAAILSHFWECKVSVEQTVEIREISNPHGWKMGENSLGKSTFLGNTFQDIVPIIHIVMRDIPFKYRDIFQEKSSLRGQLQILLDILIPADASIELSFYGIAEEALFSLSEGEKPNPILGFSTILH